jgi:glutathione gamma-glutamylcysteinyltransferase
VITWHGVAWHATQGISMDKLACLGRCNGADVEATHANNVTFDEFAAAVERVVSEADHSAASVMIVSYGRKPLNQTGTGHFSPIGAFDPVSRMVLILGESV